MTELAQVADVIDHDMDDLTASDGENKENEVMDEEEGYAEDEEPEVLEEKTEKTPDIVDEDGSNKTEMTQTNGMKEESDEKTDPPPQAANGVAKDTESKQNTQPETNEDSNMSEFALKKEARKVFMAISDTSSTHNRNDAIYPSIFS